MKYFCTSCNYIYDEGLGDASENVPAGTKIEKFEHCPSCGEGYSFQGVEEEVNYVEDSEDLDGLEIQHIPTIRIDGDELEVIVGKTVHPSGDDHRITTISLYDEYGDLVFEEFIPIDAEPVAEFDIGDLDDFEVRVKCSIHGAWGRKFSR